MADGLTIAVERLASAIRTLDGETNTTERGGFFSGGLKTAPNSVSSMMNEVMQAQLAGLKEQQQQRADIRMLLEASARIEARQSGEPQPHPSASGLEMPGMCGQPSSIVLPQMPPSNRSSSRPGSSKFGAQLLASDDSRPARVQEEQSEDMDGNADADADAEAHLAILDNSRKLHAGLADLTRDAAEPDNTRQSGFKALASVALASTGPKQAGSVVKKLVPNPLTSFVSAANGKFASATGQLAQAGMDAQSGLGTGMKAFNKQLQIGTTKFGLITGASSSQLSGWETDVIGPQGESSKGFSGPAINKAHWTLRSFLLGEFKGQLVLLLFFAGLLVMAVSVLWTLNFSISWVESLWQAYTLFIDPGTQTGLEPDAEDSSLDRKRTIAAISSILGFIYCLVAMGLIGLDTQLESRATRCTDTVHRPVGLIPAVVYAAPRPPWRRSLHA